MGTLSCNISGNRLPSRPSLHQISILPAAQPPGNVSDRLEMLLPRFSYPRFRCQCDAVINKTVLWLHDETKSFFGKLVLGFEKGLRGNLQNRKAVELDKEA